MAEIHILPEARPLVLLYSWRFVMVHDMTSWTLLGSVCPSHKSTGKAVRWNHHCSVS